MVEMKKNGIIYFRRVTYRPTLRVYFYIPTNVIARRALPDVATLRLSREQNQARLNYAEAEQGRPKVNLMLDNRRSPRRFAPRDDVVGGGKIPTSLSLLGVTDKTNA